MQARGLIGQVNRLAALERLVFDCTERFHEGGDIRDRVGDGVAGTARGDVHGLVQIARAGRVDGDKGDRAGVDTRGGKLVFELRRFLEHRWREVGGDGKFARDGAKVQRRGIKFHTPPSCQTHAQRAVQKANEPAYEPDSVPRKRAVTIHLGHPSLGASSSYLRTWAGSLIASDDPRL